MNSLLPELEGQGTASQAHQTFLDAAGLPLEGLKLRSAARVTRAGLPLWNGQETRGGGNSGLAQRRILAKVRVNGLRQANRRSRD